MGVRCVTNRVARKILAHTICALMNKKIGNPTLHLRFCLNFEKLRITLSYLFFTSPRLNIYLVEIILSHNSLTGKPLV